jgi:transposase
LDECFVFCNLVKVLEIRYRAIVHHLHSRRSLRKVAKQSGVSESSLHGWVRASGADFQTLRTKQERHARSALPDSLPVEKNEWSQSGRGTQETMAYIEVDVKCFIKDWPMYLQTARSMEFDLGKAMDLEGALYDIASSLRLPITHSGGDPVALYKEEFVFRYCRVVQEIESSSFYIHQLSDLLTCWIKDLYMTAYSDDEDSGSES